LNDVIGSFQAFFNGKAESFKLRIIFADHHGLPMHKNIEFKRGTAT